MDNGMIISVSKDRCADCNLGDCVCAAIETAERHNELIALVREEQHLIIGDYYAIVYCTSCKTNSLNDLIPFPKQPPPGNYPYHQLLAEAANYYRLVTQLVCNQCLGTDYLEFISLERDKANLTEVKDPRDVS